MKFFLPVGICCSLLACIRAAPVNNEACNRPLNVLILGYYGSGKSTIVNILHGLCDLKPKDEREVAKTSGSRKAVTKECKIYPCSYEGRKLNVVDTPGFEATSESNEAIRSEIISKVPNILHDGIDAFFFLSPIGRTPDAQ
ncbi:hypothetical protein ROZALSC1DRAFT_31886, partial [Rozella allomycis CSF55]